MNTESLQEQDIASTLLENEKLRNEIRLLKEQIDWLKRKLFGTSSERFIADPNVLYFPGFDPEDVVQPEEKVAVPAHEKRKAKSTPINTITYPETLPVETEVIDLSEEEKIDPMTGERLVCIGEDVSRKLGFRTSSYFIKEVIRKKYALAQSPDFGIKSPDLPDSIISRCAVDESFLADVIVKKYCDHLPLYRQAEIRTRDGVYVSRQTLCSYVSKVAMALKPLHQCLIEAIKSSGNVFVDETPIEVLAPGTGKTDTGYMMTLVGGKSLNPKLKAYQFVASRKHDDIMKILEGYQGVFHSDKYQAYEKLSKDPDRVWIPCFAHIRRKFEEAKSGDASFREGVLLAVQVLYTIEREVKDLSPEERMKIRQKRAIPIIDILIEESTKALSSSKILPKSKLSQAIGYLLGLSPHLKNYIQHPFAGIDNNPAERALKLVVIGRKNWMFVGSEGGGEASAILYSLTQTARALNLNPHEYFEDILRRIQSHNFNQLDELLPQNWKKL